MKKRIAEFFYYLAPFMIVIYVLRMMWIDVNDPIVKQARDAIYKCEWEIPRKQHCRITAEPIPLEEER